MVWGKGGKLTNTVLTKVFEDHQDAYATECSLK